LDRICQDLGRKLRVYIQLNLAGESQKSGIDPQELPELVDSLDTTEALKLEGLMTIPPYDENPENTRPYFRRLREILEEINRGRQQPLTELSMGMSHDFEVAIEEGATMIRVGTAIFGQRAG
ncbi:MAG TPA: YggS family pyridoxal phosphate-dependent enzyme, partial [Acidobacteriota bacterium]|nr:YggS family pyridoxal phosphate-dependent enzyme [Acidobacteriota bacterium]